MAKKGKKDPLKKAALAARKDAKADKKEIKRVKKQVKAEVGDNDDNIDNDDDDTGALDALLQQYQQDASNNIVTAYAEPLETVFPPARSNATLTLYEDTKKKNAEVYLFGGEYFDGLENVVLDHLCKYDISKKEWKRIFTPGTGPPARCAHSTVYYNHALYIFGGELATADHYHHYRDVWKYDIRQPQWQEIRSSKASGTHPSARSGHAAAVWKHFMIVFGGFYEAARDTPRWFNDVAILDLQSHVWLDVPHSKLSARPEPRSACNVDVIGDDMVVHGGFSKLSKSSVAQVQQDLVLPVSETKVHTDSWVLHLKPILQGKPPVWERLTSSIQRKQLQTNNSPNGRSGMAAVAYKNRLLVYGGVVDTEQHHHKMDSVFYNDLFAFDVGKRKWFPVHARTSALAVTAPATVSAANENDEDDNGKQRRGNDTQEAPAVNDKDDDNESIDDLEEVEEDDEEANAKHTGWDIDKLRSDFFTFVDGEGNTVYEKIDEGDENPGGSQGDGEEKEEEKESDEEKEKEKEEELDEEKEEEKTPTASSKKPCKPEPSRSKVVTSSSVMKLNSETKVPEPVSRAEPLPRIQSSLMVSGHTLFVYGGLLEVGDREVTLDDLWSFDLRKRDKWECVWPGTMHKQVWRGAVHDDDDSYYSTDTGRNKNDSDDDEDEDDDSSDDELDNKEQQTDAKKILKSDKRSDLKQEIAQMNEKHDLSDENRTPQPGEALADFVSRTSDYWNDQAAQVIKASDASAEISAKALKREGFSLARTRFEELEHVLERLAELSLESKAAKKERKESKSEKSKDKTKKKSRRLER